MTAKMNRIIGAVAALGMLGALIPTAANADDFHDGRDNRHSDARPSNWERHDVDRRDNDRRGNDRYEGFRHDDVRHDRPVAVVVERPRPFVIERPAPVVVEYRDDHRGFRDDRFAYRDGRQVLQDNKNNARNLATVGVATAAVGLLTHNNTLTAVGAIGAVVGGTTYEQDRKAQNDQPRGWGGR